MAWCPKCRFEYVDGIKVCPDCKEALVESLDDTNDVLEARMQNYNREKEVSEYYEDDLDEETKAELYERYKNFIDNPNYKSKKDQLDENKSGAWVLLICGIAGLVVLLLNQLSIITIPLRGFSLTLMNAVMGSLFFVFVVTGIMAIVKAKKLVPLVKEEEENINKIIAFIKEKKDSSEFSIDKNSEEYEALYLELSDKVVKAVNEAFPDLEPGFAFYVVDRYAGDILDED